MRTFWIWLSLLIIIWICGLLHLSPDTWLMPWRMLGTALFFAAFFLSPLLRTKPVLQTIDLIFASLLAVGVLWPDPDGAVNPFTFLVMSLLAGKAVYRLPGIHACIVGIFLVIGAYAPTIVDYPNLPPVYIGLYAVLLAIAFSVYRIVWQQAQAAESRNEALLSEYRKMKRRMASDEELARQEERAQVGRDIHDSVGHKLTALMMQLEVFRMQTDAESEVQIRNLRELARESLHETRSAVKALQDHEPGGLPAIMRLIRKLEAESVIKIHFAVKHGALSAPLTNNQSIAVYRVVQEALTNIMKHSRSREAEVLFEAPGGSVFRFEISNPGAAHAPFQEGFGFKSMRERIESNNGRLEVISNRERFIVCGTLPLTYTTSVEETAR